jgi:hypothetical protein
MRRPGLIVVMACAIATSACGSASEPEPASWQAEIPAYSNDVPLRDAVRAELVVSLTADPAIPASCVEQTAEGVSEVLVDDLGVVGLGGLGVTIEDASPVGSDAFYRSLDAETQRRVVAVVAGCEGLVEQVVGEIPGVSPPALTCLIDQVTAAAFFDAGASPEAAATFQQARNDCLSEEEQSAYDEWRAARLTAPPPVVLDPVDCGSLETAPIGRALGFDIDHFEPSLITMSEDRPVGCAYGNPDDAGPWVMLYVATQDFQRSLYRDYEPPLPEFVATWSSLTEVLDYAGVYFIGRGGSVEWNHGAVTAVFDDGRSTAAATAGDYVLMVTAGSGDAGRPPTRDEVAGAVEALSLTLALP